MAYELDKVIQQYNGRQVLCIDDLKIETGKIYGLLGANGAGKTTLFNILAFLEPPSSGTVHFKGEAIDFSKNNLHLYRRRVVLVDQSPIMFSTTVSGNIEFGLKIRGINKAQRLRIVESILEQVDLASYQSVSARELSGGETQRLAFARALALAPEVLLCDEPTANVDADNQAVILGLINRINQDQGCTILFTTHDRLQAAGLANETFVLDKGHLVSNSYENLFSCSLHQKNGRQYCLLQEKTWFQPPSGCHIPSQCNRIYLNPLKAKLAYFREEKIGDGQLCGYIVQVIAENEKVRVTLNAGVLVAVLLTNEQYKAQRFAVGDRLTITFSFHGVKWL